MRTLLFKVVVIFFTMPAAFANTVVMELVGQGVTEPVYTIVEKRVVDCYELKYFSGSKRLIELAPKDINRRHGTCSYGKGDVSLFDGLTEKTAACIGYVCRFDITESVLNEEQHAFVIYH